MSRQKQTFIKGTMILLTAGIINRILGFIPRIALPRIVGAEGVGLYQLGYPFLMVVLTLITGGIPLAVSKMVAEADSIGDERKVRSVLKIALAITSSLGIIFTALCLLGASWITAHVLTDQRVYYTFLCMSPIIPMAGISSVFRGYFQGRQNMIPTAASQTIETMIRIVMVIALAYVMHPFGIEYAAAGAMTGVMIGEAGGLYVMLHQYFRTKRSYLSNRKPGTTATMMKINNSSNLRQLLTISIPVTGSKLVGSFSYLFESILIVQSLALAGIATAVATAQYGVLQGMVMPVLLLPSALTFSLAVSLVPSLSEAAAKKDMRTIHKRLHQSLRLAFVAGAPFAVIMFVLAEPLCLLLYGQSQVGGMLKMMAPIALFIYFQAPLNATLQALNRPGTALLNTLIGAVIKLSLIYWLASQPAWGIRGAILALNVNIVLVTLLHWRSVVKLLRFSLPASDFVKVGCSMLFMGAANYLIMYTSLIPGNGLKFGCSFTVGMLVYLFSIVKFNLVDKSDIQRIPWIGKRFIR